MKHCCTLCRWIFLFSFLLGIFSPKAVLVSQTYCYQFDETVVGGTLEVDIILTPSSPFKLGTTTAKFSVNPLAISLVNPIQFTASLPATYTTSVSSPSLGIISFSAVYTGAAGAGKNVPTTGLKVGKMVFNIINPLITTDFKLLNKGLKSLILFKDDNATVLAPSAQCPPSPYTSMFYDAHIELDADIPMDECVESTTPNSVKINFGDDETKEILPAGFKFNFYCNEVTSLRLGADGALLVNADPAATLAPTNQPKLTSVPRIIAPWWDEWRKGMGTINCLVKNTTVNGIATRMLIIQWNNFSPVDNITGSNLDTDPLKATFNVVIFENLSIIKFNYKDIDFTGDIATRPDLLPVVEQKQNGVNGSVGMKGICGTGLPRDGVNNIVFDGPIGISLFDVNSARVYKSITFMPITEACNVPIDPIEIKICQNSTAFKLPVASAALNGKWVGTGVPFLNNANIQAATFTPTTAGNYTLKWSPDCTELGFTVNITVSPTATANAGADQNICAGTTVNLVGVVGGSAISGVWSAPNGIFSDVNALTSTYTAGIPSGTVVLTLTTVNTDATCPVVTSTVTVKVNPAVYAGLDGSMNICNNSSVTMINLFDLITGEQSGGTWTRTAGSGGIFDAAAGTFTTAANMTSSLFKYTLIGTAPCPDDESRVAINIISPPDAGRDGSTAVCDNSTTEIDLRSLITGEQNGGGWVRLTGTGGTFVVATGKFTPSIGTTTSTFKYTVAGFPPCVGMDEAIATVNISPFVTAGVDGSMTICDISTATIDLFSLITGEQSGGTWTRQTGSGGAFDAIAGTFTPSVSATSSTFQYKLIGTAPCPDAVSIATVNITPKANAGADGSTSICDNSTTTIDLFALISGEQSGGTWSRLTGTGGVFNATTGTFTPSVNSTNSTFKYLVNSVSPCIDIDEAIATVNISLQVYAGLDGSTTICNSSIAMINLFSLITGEQSGGIWTRLTGTGGIFDATVGTFTPSLNATSSTFRYALTAVSPCPDDEAIATVNIVEKVDAGFDGSTTICSSNTSILNLFSLINGEQSGGIWTRLTGTGGVFNAASGTFTPSVSATSSTFQYSLTGISPCPDDVSIAEIIIIPQAQAGTDGSITQCDNFTTTVYLSLLISGEQSGGVWTRLTGTGGTFDATNATFTPTVGTTSSTFQYTITGVSPCSDDVSIATVTMIPQAKAGADGTTIICSNETPTIDLFNTITGEQSGGTWTRLTGTGGTFNAAVGTFTPAIGTTNSTFQYTVLSTFPCSNDISIATITILPKANAGLDGTLKVCDNVLTTIDLYTIITGEQTGGTWTRLTGTGGIFNAVLGTFTPSLNATNSTFQYALTGATACSNDESIASLTVIPHMNPGLDGSTTICNLSTTIIDLFSLITGEQSGGMWTRINGTGGVFNAAAGTFTPSVDATSSMFRYNLPGLSPCSNAESFAMVNVNEAIAPNFSPITVCQHATTASLPTTSLNGITGTWSPALINNQATATYTFTPTVSLCATTTTLTVTVIPITKPDAGPDQITCAVISSRNFTMSASVIPSGSTGKWTFVGTSNGAITDINDPYTTVIGVNTANPALLSWTIINPLGCSASDTVSIGKDNIAPTIDTYDKQSSIAGSTNEIGGDAYVCANIVIKTLSDNCSTYNDLLSRVSIVRDADNPSRTYLPNFSPCLYFTCADANKKILTQVWVVDKAGNASYKLTYISVQDNLNFCGHLSPQSVSIKTETNRPVNNVTVSAYMNGSTAAATLGTSDNTGITKLLNLNVGENYQLKATKTDESALGVTSYDIGIINQHILGIKPITSPYALLAADVNEDGEIDIADVLAIRNFILQRTTSLPKRAWRFVDSSYIFKQPTKPFAEDVPEIISFVNKLNNTQKAFTAIKYGDVSNTTQTTGLAALPIRNTRVLTLKTEDIALEKGKDYAINITAENFNALNFQFTLDFTDGTSRETQEGGAIVKNIEMGDLPNMTNGNFSMFKNALTTSWNGKALSINANIFTLHFTANKTGLLSEVLSLGSAITFAEANDVEGNPMSIQLKFTKGKTVGKTFALYQNYPNPFEKQTKIAFDLPYKTNAQLTIYNISGQVLYTKNAPFQAGFNEILIEKDVLNTEGVLYYRLDTPEHSATRKMIVLNR